LLRQCPLISWNVSKHNKLLTVDDLKDWRNPDLNEFENEFENEFVKDEGGEDVGSRDMDLVSSISYGRILRVS
jgi:hypothetical protein